MTQEELHALGMGYAEGLDPLPPHHRLPPGAEYTPLTEYHYYLAGRAAGHVTFLILLTLLAHFVKGGSQ